MVGGCGCDDEGGGGRNCTGPPPLLFPASTPTSGVLLMSPCGITGSVLLAVCLPFLFGAIFASSQSDRKMVKSTISDKSSTIQAGTKECVRH